MTQPLFDSNNEISSLKQQLAQREAELAIINAVQHALAAELDIHGIYEAVGDKLCAIFDAQAISIYSSNFKTQMDTLEYYFKKGRKYEPMTVPLNSLYNYINELNKTFVLNGDFPQFAEKFKDYKVPQGEMPTSVLNVPVFRNDDTGIIVGIAIMDVDGGKFFSESEIRLLETLAGSMHVALENARLLDELQKSNREITEALEQQKVTSRVLQIIAGSPTEFQPVLDAIAESAARLCESNDASVMLVDGQSLRVFAHWGSIPLQVGEAFLLDRKLIAGRAVIDRHPIHVLDVMSESDDEIGLSKELNAISSQRTVLVVPLLREGPAIGAIGLRRQQVNPFTEKQIGLVKTFADQAVIAFENARLFDETQRLLKETEQRAQELAIINTVQTALASRLDFLGVISAVGDKIREIFPKEDVLIGLIDREHNMLRIPYIYNIALEKHFSSEFPLGQGLANIVITTHQPLLINADLTRRSEELGGVIAYTYEGQNENEVSTKSWLGVPIIVGDEAIGGINLQNSDHENAYSESDVRLLQILASSMSVALENARLWEQEKLYRKALEREFEIGREIQAGFLPDSLPQPIGWEIAASLKSAREVAGDFYDVFELPDGQIGLVIADVCDKGLGAALFMTLFRSLIRAVSNIDFFARIGSGDANSSAMRLKNAISLTNNYIAETHGDTGMFATIFFGILNSRTGVLTYINGGHLPPLIINAYGVKEILKFSGPAVGAIADADYVIKEIMIEQGESFFAYTDGLTDTVNPAGEFFSEKVLIPLLINGQPLSPLLAQIQKQVSDHAAGTKQFDDITLLALRRT